MGCVHVENYRSKYGALEYTTSKKGVFTMRWSILCEQLGEKLFSLILRDTQDVNMAVTE